MQELEGGDWGEPEFQSYVVTNAHRLHRIPLREFTVEDLRFLIGQQRGLPCLVPIALEHLRADPFVEGDLYAGDLLTAVLRADSRFWSVSSELRAEASRLAQQALSLLPSLDEIDRQTAQDTFTDAYDILQRADRSDAAVRALGGRFVTSWRLISGGIWTGAGVSGGFGLDSRCQRRPFTWSQCISLLPSWNLPPPRSNLTDVQLPLPWPTTPA